jgi:hypothetical protein
MKTLSDVKARLLKDKATREAYAALEDEFSIAHELISVRLKAGLTQIEVVERRHQAIRHRLSEKRPNAAVAAHAVALCTGDRVYRDGKADAGLASQQSRLIDAASRCIPWQPTL